MKKKTQNGTGWSSKILGEYCCGFAFLKERYLDMKERNILIAFLLNLFFAIFEFVGGMFTNSVSIMSDAIHDIGDALSIGVSYWLERKSKKKADANYTYGYARYSVIGGAFTTLVLICGSCVAIGNAIYRIINPVAINYNGMIIFAIVGVVVNLIAAIATRKGDSINQKAVNLHMLEDVAGWVTVLIGAIVMRFTDFSIIDPVLSIAIAVWILIHAIKAFVESIALLADRSNVSSDEVVKVVGAVGGVLNVHHVHVWQLDEKNNCVTMHVVVEKNHVEIKKKIRDALKEIGIDHSTLELEGKWECCDSKRCDTKIDTHVGCACHQHRERTGIK